MAINYSINIGGAQFRAKVSKKNKNYELQKRQFKLLEMLAKTINSRKKSTDEWLKNDEVAYDFAMEVWNSLRQSSCFLCEEDRFEPVMQDLIMKRLTDYGESVRKGFVKKSATTGAECTKTKSFDAPSTPGESDDDSDAPTLSDVLYEAGAYTPDERAAIMLDAMRIKKALKKCSKKARLCFLLHSRGYTNREIAVELGVHESYIGRLMERTIAQVKNLLKI